MIDSDRYHGSLLDQRRDHAQTEALRAAGWTVLRFDEHEIWQRAEHVAAVMRAARSPLRRFRSAPASSERAAG